MPRDRVLDWLLESDQPSVPYLALTQLLRRSETDSDVRDAKARIPTAGWAAEILARRDPGGWWVRNRHPKYRKYISTNWNLLALSTSARRARSPGCARRASTGWRSPRWRVVAWAECRTGMVTTATPATWPGR